jgi:NADH-quinone oxidoreductase subunit E
MSEGNKISHALFSRENKPVAFSPEVLGKIRDLIKRYPEGQEKSALMPVLHMAQEELGGYLSVDVMDYVASLLAIRPIEVYEVATFYSMFYIAPVGKFVIEICRTGPCAISGGEHILHHLEEVLKIKTGETTPDGIFTLKTVECLGSCGTAPVMQVNTRFYENLTNEKIDQILEDLRTRGDLSKPEEERWAAKFC